MGKQMLPHRFVSPILMWAIVWAGIIAAIFLVPAFFVFEPNILTATLFLFAISIWCAFVPVSVLFENRGAAGSAAGVRKIIDTGNYAIVRHPIYFGDISLSWGIFMIFPTSVSLACAIWLTVAIVGWARLEERALLEKFGKEYEDYKKRVPMIVPRII